MTMKEFSGSRCGKRQGPNKTIHLDHVMGIEYGVPHDDVWFYIGFNSPDSLASVGWQRPSEYVIT
jgi:hypothetical protein